MDTPIISSKSTAKDFFLTLGLTVTLYLIIGSFLRLVFAIVNYYYPPQLNYFNFITNTISFPVATLIIVFPVYLGLAYLNHKILMADLSRLNLGIRKWLSYLTLFIATAVIVGDLVYILYAYLDGQDISTAFLLKSVAVIITAIIVISYYYQSQKAVLSRKVNLAYGLISGLLILLAIIGGFTAFGSPRYQRLSKLDSVRSRDLATINSLVLDYWRNNAKLPATLEDIKQNQEYSIIPTDPGTKAAYTYQKTTDLAYKLCATFDTTVTKNNPNTTMYGDSAKFYTHPSGNHCIDYSINPKLNPAYPKMVPVTY